MVMTEKFRTKKYYELDNVKGTCCLFKQELSK